MNRCMICNKIMDDGLEAVLDENHKTHLKCWCDLLPYIQDSTEKERREKLKELIELFKGDNLNVYKR